MRELVSEGQKAAPDKKRIHPFIAGQLSLPCLFRHWLSVSLYLSYPLYSFSQRRHTEERQTVRRRVSSPLTYICSCSLSDVIHGSLVVSLAERGFLCVLTFQRRNASRASNSRTRRMVRTMIHHGTPPYWASRLSGNTVSLTYGNTRSHGASEPGT